MASVLAMVVVALIAVVLTRGGGGNRAGETSKPTSSNSASLNSTPSGEEDLLARYKVSADVEPPAQPDAENLAVPGLIVATNSDTWRKLVDAPQVAGVVVLLVLPDGPSDGKGIERGDTITSIDGRIVTNSEHLLVLVRSRVGEQRELNVVDRDGGVRTVEITGVVPRLRARDALDDLIKANPGDPVLRFLRANTAGTYQQNMDDLDQALEREPNFVEALASRAEYLFNQKSSSGDEKSFVGQAFDAWDKALAIDPENADVLQRQAGAFNSLGKPVKAKSKALEALKIDQSLPYANHALARANLALSDAEGASGPARLAIDLNPYSNLSYYRTLAEVFRDLGRSGDCSTTLLAVVPYLEGLGIAALATEADQLKKESKENCG